MEICESFKNAARYLLLRKVCFIEWRRWLTTDSNEGSHSGFVSYFSLYEGLSRAIERPSGPRGTFKKTVQFFSDRHRKLWLCTQTPKRRSDNVEEGQTMKSSDSQWKPGPGKMHPFFHPLVRPGIRIVEENIPLGVVQSFSLPMNETRINIIRSRSVCVCVSVWGRESLMMISTYLVSRYNEDNF